MVIIITIVFATAVVREMAAKDLDVSGSDRWFVQPIFAGGDRYRLQMDQQLLWALQGSLVLWV